MSFFKCTASTLLLCTIAATTAYAQQPKTTVKVVLDDNAKIQVSFAKQPRVSQSVFTALQQLDTSTLDIHWQSSGLYDVSSPLALKQETLMRLANEEDFAPMSQKNHWHKLRQTIREMRFGHKITTPIDPDATRINAAVNPLISGQWVLNLRTHADSVLVLGNVKNEGEQPWRQRQDAKTYADSAGLLTNSLSKLTVIQPSGQVETHKIAYWNRDFHEVAPGAIVYVSMPHAHTWFDVDKPNVSTNQVVVELLRNRLP
ncbi:capsule biosynthesis GfcC family protein [Vibrio palustris]|uniref:Uncharacterized protein n=1 Tax=Vibrio palustris TaxID=1918946 RepID=A0A1R4B3P1_9VIBR|nr:capsule biosynthesis GfcC family protein [Vibrio palustris]SJL83526.1 hypothetical protein VPAL9027_01494 [Vibrio palustris]